MNASPCAGWLLWDAAVLREFCLQPPLPMRWAFQAWNTDKVELSEHVPLPGARPWVTVGPVRASDVPPSVLLTLLLFISARLWALAAELPVFSPHSSKCACEDGESVSLPV